MDQTEPKLKVDDINEEQVGGQQVSQLGQETLRSQDFNTDIKTLQQPEPRNGKQPETEGDVLGTLDDGGDDQPKYESYE